MAGVLIHDVSGYTGEKYNLKIPSLTDPANIQEAMMLFHYGIDNYDGSVEPAEDSVFGNLKDFDDRIAQLELTEVVQLEGTENEIVSSGSVGFVTLSLPDELIAPLNFSVSNNLLVSGSASFSSDVLFVDEVVFQENTNFLSGIDAQGNITVQGDTVLNSASASELNVSGSSVFQDEIQVIGGINVFADEVSRDERIPNPPTGTIVYMLDKNQQFVYNGIDWIAIEGGSGMEDIFLLMGA
jgi:hypothetical protein